MHHELFVAWNGVITSFCNLAWLDHIFMARMILHGDAHAEHPVHQRAGTLRPRVADPPRTSREGPERPSCAQSDTSFAVQKAAAAQRFTS